MKLDQTLFKIVVVGQALPGNSLTGDTKVDFFVKVLIPVLNLIYGKTLAIKLAD